MSWVELLPLPVQSRPMQSDRSIDTKENYPHPKWDCSIDYETFLFLSRECEANVNWVHDNDAQRTKQTEILASSLLKDSLRNQSIEFENNNRDLEKKETTILMLVIDTEVYDIQYPRWKLQW